MSQRIVGVEPGSQVFSGGRTLGSGARNTKGQWGVRWPLSILLQVPIVPRELPPATHHDARIGFLFHFLDPGDH